MALLSLVEAAVKVGYSIELLKYLTKNCPKHDEDRTLHFVNSDNGILIDESELLQYQRYLNESWPIPKGAKRPPMRDAIAKDVKEESHYECAICSRGDNGEVAHIHAVEHSACNGPDNLLFLCPNHHTAYDFGFRSANITLDVVLAAKTMKRDSRRRMLGHEVNATKAMFGLIRLINKIALNMKTVGDADMRKVAATEIKSLLAQVAKASNAAAANAKTGVDFTALERELNKIAPNIALLAGGGADANTEYAVRQIATKVVAASNKVIIDLGEVECPHCEGTGRRGMSGRFCAFCGGSCYVATEMAKEYNPDDIDEEECPRCHGRCQTGLVGDICAYCTGDGVVTKDEAEDYDPGAIDEVDCPHCCARGQRGLMGTLCSYCGGSCLVSKKTAKEYDRKAIDEVRCPRCGGRGRTGLSGSICAYCDGNCYVTKEQRKNYDPDELNEVECPHCDGTGKKGRAGNFCSYCNGDCVVSRKAKADYDPDKIDEEECPRCGGSGQTGHVGDICKLCDGDCVVAHATADAYRKKYGGYSE